MGYACPVCETPQQDARHLANHLAFTAMVHGDEHEAWLDEHVPDWSELGEADLGPEVAELAPEADYDQVFEDTAHAHGHEHDHGHDHRHGGVDPASAAAAGQGSLDEETQRILAEARELTAEMLDDEDDGADTVETDESDTEE
ncbi:DUF5810 domain-containing protein [Halobellus rubicundus]|uniref:DUF5810 domain-containing protein n=1 Tax=Halobellus rubicundus TaxID=2996466 RepID=A0ABD5M7Z3_9EURY